MSGGAPPIPNELRGQFVLTVPGAPYGPRPGAADNTGFIDEADTVADTLGYEAAGRFIAPWVGWANHAPIGPPWTPRGYSGQYPQTNWIGRADAYADFLTWMVQRIPVLTLFMLPDAPPYFVNNEDYNWPLIEQDLTPIFRHPRIQALANAGHLRVCSQWETYSTIEKMQPVWAYMQRMFPQVKRFWHNPPGHLSPAQGHEDEQAAWRSAVAGGIDGLLLQGAPIDSNVFTARPLPYIIDHPEDRTIIERTIYDLWDMERRFVGAPGSPWGPAFITTSGVPATVEAAEGTAYYMYWESPRAQDVCGESWRRCVREVPGVANVLDGLPEH